MTNKQINEGRNVSIKIMTSPTVTVFFLFSMADLNVWVGYFPLWTLLNIQPTFPPKYSTFQVLAYFWGIVISFDFLINSRLLRSMLRGFLLVWNIGRCIWAGFDRRTFRLEKHRDNVCYERWTKFPLHLPHRELKCGNLFVSSFLEQINGRRKKNTIDCC